MRRYLVFGRKVHTEPLAFEGFVEAEDDEAASRAARAGFADSWVELVLVPEADLFWVIKPKEAAYG